MDFNNKLYELRKQKGLSQEQLAKLIGTQKSNISRIESGKQNLTVDMMIKICDALEKNVDLVLEERGDPVSNIYRIKLYDTSILTFKLEDKGLEGLKASVISVRDDLKHLFPLDLIPTSDGVLKWLRKRVIPKNRAFVDEILKSLGLSVNDTKGIIDVCKGLSLNDSFWVVPDDFDGTFEEYNLFENRFSEVLSLVAYTGIGADNKAFTTSPELTTSGMLRKAWRYIENDGIYLYKGGTSGASNTGNEPYSELYAYYIGTRMGMDVVPYHLSKWKGTLCSVCELFTDIDTAFVPIGRLIKNGGMDDVKKYYESLGPEYVKRLNEMIVFDAIICNTDRHFGNFGVLVNSRTNEIISPAPLFDHGNSLFNMAGNYWDSKEELQEYVDTLKPRVYEDFIEEARLVMDNNLREKVRHILNIEIGRIGKYNYSKEKRNLLESQITNRAKLLL